MMKPVLANTPELARQCLQEIDNTRLVFLDTETSGLDHKRNHVVGWVLKAHGSPSSYYVPVRHLGGGNLPGCDIPTESEGWRGDLHWFEKELAQIASSDYNRRWVGHNLPFDLRMSERHGVVLAGDLEDTQNNAALINENSWSYSLENQAKEMEVTAKLGEELYQYISDLMGMTFTPMRKSMEHFWRTDASNPVVYEYAAGDDITTEELWEAQQKILDEEELRRVWAVENRLLRTIHRMTKRGVPVNQDQLQKVHDFYGLKVKALEREFPKGFNTNAPSQIAKFLEHRIDDNWPRNPINATILKRAEKLGIPPKGALKFDEKALSLVPEGRAILDLRKIKHAQSSFTTPMMERHLYKGRVHCEFNQMKKDDFGTISGRLSSSDPNLQQVPKRDKVIGPTYRTIFEPEEGHYWDTNDYKQQEYVVFTDYTRDPNLMAGYNANPPIDIHQMVANMLGVERDPTAKRMNLGMLYGMGIAKMAASLGVSEATARAWMNEYHAKFPGIKGTKLNPGFLKKAENRAKKRGFVMTYLGRRRRFTFETAHKAGNGIIQGSSADVTKVKMVEVDDYFESEGDEAYLMLQVHDALDNSIPIGKEYLGEEARKIMKNFSEGQLIKMGVPLGVDNGVGENWAIATYGRELVEKAFASV